MTSPNGNKRSIYTALTMAHILLRRNALKRIKLKIITQQVRSLSLQVMFPVFLQPNQILLRVS